MSLNPDILATCVEAVRSRRLSVDECVAAHPANAVELRAILEVVIAIGPPPPVAMDSIARSRGRAALIAAMATDKPVARQSPGLGNFESRLAALLGPGTFNLRTNHLPALMVALVFVASMTLGSGVVAASGNALPGDALYPLKLSVENVQLAAVFGDQAKAQFALRQAAGRLAEIDRANEIGRTDAITTAATNYVQDVANANQHLADAAASGQDVRVSASALNGELARQSEELAHDEGQVPASARTSVAAAARAARSGIDANGVSRRSPGVGNSGAVPESTRTPTIRPNKTPGPSSTASRSPDGAATDLADQTETDNRRPPGENAKPQASVESGDAGTAPATRGPESDGLNDGNELTPTSDSSAPVLASPTPRSNREREATNTPRPTGAEEQTDESRATRTPTPTESAHRPPKATRVRPRHDGTDNSSGSDQGEGDN